VSSISSVFSCYAGKYLATLWRRVVSAHSGSSVQNFFLGLLRPGVLTRCRSTRRHMPEVFNRPHLGCDNLTY